MISRGINPQIKSGNFVIEQSSFWSTLSFPRLPDFNLLNDLRQRSSADRAAALADSEAQALLHGDRRNQLDFQVHVVARHHHLRARWQVRHSRHVSGAEVELRAVAVEERSEDHRTQ